MENNITTQTLIEKMRAALQAEKKHVNVSNSSHIKYMITTHGIDASAAIADIREFNKLIEDYVLRLTALTANEHTGSIDINLGSETKSYVPRITFLCGVANKANSRTSITNCSGMFLNSLRDGPRDGVGYWADLMNYLFDIIDDAQVKSKRAADNVKIRCLKAHPEGKWNLAKPAIRAIVSEGYKDNNSHLWLLESLQKMAPSGKITHFSFNGDIMSGFWIIPDIIISDKEDTDEFGVGFMFRQGEIANASCTVEPAIFVSNSYYWCSWGKILGEKFTLRHNSAFDSDKTFISLMAAIDRQIPLLTTAVNKIIATKKIVIDRTYLRQYVVKLSKTYGITADVAQIWLDNAINDFTKSNAYEIVNAFIATVSNLGEELKQKYIEITQRIVAHNWEVLNKEVATILDSECEQFLTM